MANKKVFKKKHAGVQPPAADTTNRAGGKAYAMGEKAALAQYAATGTFNDTFYSTAEAQVSEVLAICAKVDVEFIGKVALYARQSGRMKDMPALLCAHLTSRGQEGMDILKRIFLTVIDNGKMLRNFVQIMQSRVVGRQLTGTAPIKLVQSWFAAKQPADIFKMSVGNDPTMKDILALAHVADLGSPERKALYSYLYGKEFDFESLPPLVKAYETLKKDPSTAADLPKVPFEMLMGLPLTEKQWKDLALMASWTQLRMSLNTFSRHGVFKSESVTKQLADKLSDAVLIEKAKPFPYQIFTAYLFTETSGDEAVPQKMKSALHDALEIAAKNVKTYEGQAYIAVDTSGSMGSPVTGVRAGSTSKMTCVDVASLIASTFLKKNRETQILPFDTSLHLKHGLDPHDSVMTNADKLRKFGGGGTDCGLALAHLNRTKAKGDLVIYVSDNESWFDNNRFTYGGSTSMATEWAAYKARNQKAKLVCIDLQAAATVQVKSDGNVLNIGGFTDAMWEVINKFVEGVPSADYWVEVISQVQLPEKKTVVTPPVVPPTSEPVQESPAL